MGGGGVEDTNTAEVIAIGVILGSLLIHSVIMELEHRFERHRHLTLMLQELYRELMILGIISLGLFLVEVNNTSLSDSEKHLFEQVHLTVFLVVILYAVLMFSFMGLSVWMSKKWKRLDIIGTTQYVDNRAKLEDIKALYRVKKWYQRLFAWKFWWESRQISEKVLFGQMRLHFIHSNHLRRDFPFSKYLQKCKRHVFLQLARVHRYTWIFLIVVIVGYMIIQNQIFAKNSLPYVTNRELQMSFALLGFLITSSVMIIAWKNYSILEHVVHSDLIDFDPVAARYYYHHSWFSASSRKLSLQASRRHLAHLSQADVEEKKDENLESERLPASIPQGREAPYLLSVSERYRKSEEAAKQIARQFDISKWKSSDAAVATVIKPPSCTDVPAKTVIIRDASYSRASKIGKRRPSIEILAAEIQEHSQQDQLELFWFGSHEVTLYLMQAIVISFVFYLAVIFQFTSSFFPGGSAVEVILSVLLVLPIPFLLFFFPSAVLSYTLAIHIGQLVDVDVVIEALEKADEDSLDENPQGAQSREVLNPSEFHALVRELTMENLSQWQKIQVRTKRFIFGDAARSIVLWLVVIDLCLVAVQYVEENDVIRAIDVTIDSLFMIELMLKLWLGAIHFRDLGLFDFWLLFDCFVILINFILSILMFFMIPFWLGFLVCLRLVNVFRLSQTEKIVLDEFQQQLISELSPEMRLKLERLAPGVPGQDDFAEEKKEEGKSEESTEDGQAEEIELVPTDPRID
jgi:hypothetical protein